jgi:hypothetical protein
MNVCPYCGHHYKEGELVCEACHRSLIHHTPVAVVDTRWLEVARETMSEDAEAEAPAPEACGYKIVLQAKGVPDALALEISRPGLILGRADLHGRIFPDVDLSPFGARECGVSRRHARLVLNTATSEVEIIDLGSTNGTYVNGQRLPARQAHFLSDSDEVRLGDLVLNFFYET